MANQLEKFPDLAMGLDRVTQFLRFVHFVMIASADSLTGNVSGVLQVLHNPLDRSLGDSNFDSHFTQNLVWMLVNNCQNMRVVGQKCPA